MMKKSTRVLSLLTALLLALAFLGGCADVPAPTDVTADVTADVTTATPDTANIPDCDFAIGKATVNGADLLSYTAVYEADDLLARAAAEQLRDYLLRFTGAEIAVSPDTEPETEHEFRIGDTARSGELPDAPEGEYYLFVSEDDIIASGEGLMAAGAAGSFISSFLAPHEDEKGAVVNIELPTEPTAAEYTFRDAKNVIICIGDGMGRHMGEYLEDTELAEYFVPHLFPYFCKCRTVSFDGTTDSAASGTALATGKRTYNSRLGLDSEGAILKNVREYADERGWLTAVLTTDDITGATTAAFTVHIEDRNLTEEIASQQAQINIAYMKGEAGDDLPACAAEALGTISQGKGFFMLLEEADIDLYGHSQNLPGATEALLRFNNALAYVTAFTLAHPDTLLIVTADHDNSELTKGQDGTYYYLKEGHTSEPVGAWALGPTADYFDGGMISNSDVGNFMIETISKY